VKEAKWDGYDTMLSRNMKFICSPGRIQLRWFNRVRSLGMSPHDRMKDLLVQDLSNLNDNSIALDDMEREYQELGERIKEEKQRKKAMPQLSTLLDRKLVSDIDERIAEVSNSHNYNPDYVPTAKSLYFTVKNASDRFDVPFTSVLNLLESRVQEKFPGEVDAEFRLEVLRQIACIRKNGKDGALTSEDLERVFTEACI
jgi:hypothetical protein